MARSTSPPRTIRQSTTELNFQLRTVRRRCRNSPSRLRRRWELPWVRINKKYSFETDEGKASLTDLFRGRSQLIVYHFMFGPPYTDRKSTRLNSSHLGISY